MFAALATVPGANDRHLAAALFVSPAAVSGWRGMVKARATAGLNDKQRDSIQSVALLEGERLTDGMQAAADRMRAAVTDLETVVRVRRALSGTPTSQAEGGGDDRRIVQARKARGTKREPDRGHGPDGEAVDRGRDGTG